MPVAGSSACLSHGLGMPSLWCAYTCPAATLKPSGPSYASIWPPWLRRASRLCLWGISTLFPTQLSTACIARLPARGGHRLRPPPSGHPRPRLCRRRCPPPHQRPAEGRQRRRGRRQPVGAGQGQYRGAGMLGFVGGCQARRPPGRGAGGSTQMWPRLRASRRRVLAWSTCSGPGMQGGGHIRSIRRELPRVWTACMCLPPWCRRSNSAWRLLLPPRTIALCVCICVRGSHGQWGRRGRGLGCSTVGCRSWWLR